MRAEDKKARIERIALLAEPTRRALYLYVVEQGRDVGRDEAARAVGASRNLVAFHLDKLAEAGLLETSFRRARGASGPGAGRPAKLYRRSSLDVQISLPERRYGLAARLLVRAIERANSKAAEEALRIAAAETGIGIGRLAAERARARGRRAASITMKDLVGILEEQGFEPKKVREGDVVLRNCPFHALAEENRELVCGMNLELLRGVVQGLGTPGVEAVLDPHEGMCCVRLRRK